MQKPFTQLGQRHNIIRQFTPNWFTVSMGTGVVALIISEFPMIKALTWQLGTGLWYFNILLFVLFSVLYGLRWAFGGVLKSMLTLNEAIIDVKEG